MGKAILAAFITLVAGLLTMSIFTGAEEVGIIVAIAVMGAFISNVTLAIYIVVTRSLNSCGFARKFCITNRAVYYCIIRTISCTISSNFFFFRVVILLR